MKLLFKRIASAVIVTALVAATAVTPVAASAETAKTLERDTSYTGLAVDRYSDTDAIKQGIAIKYDDITLNGVVAEEDFLFAEKDELSFSFSAPTDGTYYLACEYKVQEDQMTDSLFDVVVDGTTFNTTLPVLRRDEQQQYSLDRDGDELAANQIAIEDKWITTYFDNYTDLNRISLEMDLTAGEHTISVVNNIQSIIVKAFYIVEKIAAPSYSEYAASLKGDVADDLIIVEGERYAITTTSSVKASANNNSSLYPYETNSRRVNTLFSGATAGQEVAWEVEVEQDGLYAISFRLLQNANSNMPVYRNMKIDGRTLFEEMNNIAISPTKSNTYDNFTFEVNGEAAYIYLTKGKHTISLAATMGPMAEVYQDILDLMGEINQFGMDINKLASSNTDENRTWDTEAYFPNAVSDLRSYAKKARELYAELEKLSNLEPVYANDLEYAADILDEIADTPRTIPNKAEEISMGDSSASKYLGSVIGKLVAQSLSIDRLYISGDEELPKASASFFKKLFEGIKQFFISFSDDYNEDKDNEELEVWMASSIQYVQTLQQIVDEKYNAVHGTDIEISVMAGEQKLVLANAAGTAPDVVLGVTFTTPFNLAIRGASKNLLEYDDFLDFYNKEYNLEALIPMCYGDGIYGATVTQDFQILYYRKDIMNSLGLQVPNTWDDVKAMMPLLLRHNMNFFLPLSASTAMKTMAVTAPFVYQHNSSFYSTDGLKVEFDSINAVNAFAEMTELYKIYSLDKAVANFYNSFRYGEIPLGISGFSTYLQLELAAPELTGQWGTALVPGEEQEDGSILRYQIADSTACMILESTDKPEEAWSFMKWFLTSDTQYEYATLLRTSLGSEYRWNTANLAAFARLPYPEDHKAVILKQWESQKELVPHAASYMIERETSNVWNNVVVNGKGLIESIDSAAILSNREIIRKMQEFGFCDANGNPTSEYKAMTYLDLVNLLNDQEDEE